MSWPAVLTDDYPELLNQKQPQAMIILAYYGVLLHFCRDSWALCNLGANLVKAINKIIGPHLRRWMAWPNKMIEIKGEAP